MNVVYFIITKVKPTEKKFVYEDTNLAPDVLQ